MTRDEYLLNLEVHTLVMGRAAPTVEEMRAEAEAAWERQPSARHFSSLGGFSFARDEPEHDQFRVATPEYTQSLDQAARMETHLQQTPRQWMAYVNALAALTGFSLSFPTTVSMGRFVGASARTRCLAALAAVGARDLQALLAEQRQRVDYSV